MIILIAFFKVIIIITVITKNKQREANLIKVYNGNGNYKAKGKIAYLKKKKALIKKSRQKFSMRPKSLRTRFLNPLNKRKKSLLKNGFFD